MKWIKWLFVSTLVFGIGSDGVALAQYHHHGARFGVYIGPGPWGWYYPPPYYYDPYPPVVVQSAPQTYVEQAQESTPGPSGYWYYCSKPDGYYPYVKQCPGGWHQVAPQPPSPP